MNCYMSTPWTVRSLRFIAFISWYSLHCLEEQAASSHCYTYVHGVQGTIHHFTMVHGVGVCRQIENPCTHTQLAAVYHGVACRQTIALL